MNIAPQNQPSLESLRRLAVAAVATARTLLGFAQAADWNGRTLTMLLLSTLLCKIFDGKFDSFEASIIRPLQRRFESALTPSGF
jgi:hypothetical protein